MDLGRFQSAYNNAIKSSTILRSSTSER